MKRTHEQGFTLLETVIAVLILTIGMLSLYSLQVTSMRGNVIASSVTQASNLDALQVETLLAGKFGDLEGKGKECLFKDPNEEMKPLTPAVLNRCLEKGSKWELGPNDKDKPWKHRSQAQTPEKQPDPDRYFVNYNVAEDYPTENVKTVRVHVFTLFRNQGPGKSEQAVDPGLKPVSYDLIINNPVLN